jgi:hypothetical protein
MSSGHGASVTWISTSLKCNRGSARKFFNSSCSIVRFVETPDRTRGFEFAIKCHRCGGRLREKSLWAHLTACPQPQTDSGAPTARTIAPHPNPHPPTCPICDVFSVSIPPCSVQHHHPNTHDRPHVYDAETRHFQESVLQQLQAIQDYRV